MYLHVHQSDSQIELLAQVLKPRAGKLGLGYVCPGFYIFSCPDMLFQYCLHPRFGVLYWRFRDNHGRGLLPSCEYFQRRCRHDTQVFAVNQAQVYTTVRAVRPFGPHQDTKNSIFSDYNKHTTLTLSQAHGTGVNPAQ